MEKLESIINKIKAIRNGDIKPYFWGQEHDMSNDLDGNVYVDIIPWLENFKGWEVDQEKICLDDMENLEHYYTYNDENLASNDVIMTTYKDNKDNIYIVMSIHLYGDAYSGCFSDEVIIHVKDVNSLEEFNEKYMYGSEHETIRTQYIDVNSKHWFIDSHMWYGETTCLIDDETYCEQFETYNTQLDDIREEIIEFMKKNNIN